MSANCRAHLALALLGLLAAACRSGGDATTASTRAPPDAAPALRWPEQLGPTLRDSARIAAGVGAATWRPCHAVAQVSPTRPGPRPLWPAPALPDPVVRRLDLDWPVARPSTVAHSPDASLIAVGDDAGRVAIIDALDGQLLAQATVVAGRVSWLAFTPDGQSLVAASDCRVEVARVDLASGAVTHSALPGQLGCRIRRGISLDAEGARIASYADDTQTFEVHDVASGESLLVLDDPTPRVSSRPRLGSDGACLDVRPTGVFHVESGHRVPIVPPVLAEHAQAGADALELPDARVRLRDDGVLLVDTASGELRWTLPPSDSSPWDPSEGFDRVALSDDAGLIVAATDRTLALWHPDTERPILVEDPFAHVDTDDELGDTRIRDVFVDSEGETLFVEALAHELISDREVERWSVVQIREGSTGALRREVELDHRLLAEAALVPGLGLVGCAQAQLMESDASTHALSRPTLVRITAKGRIRKLPIPIEHCRDFAGVSGELALVHEDSRLAAYALRSGERGTVVESTRPELEFSARSLRVDAASATLPDGLEIDTAALGTDDRFVATVMSDRSVWIWSLEALLAPE